MNTLMTSVSLASLSIVLLNLTSCAPVASSYEYSYGSVSSNMPVSGIPYFLPRARILVVGKTDGSTYKITMSRQLFPDRSRRLFASFEGSSARNDEFAIGVKDGLLDNTVTVKSKDETAAIAGAVTELALNTAKLSTFQLKADTLLGDADAPQPFSVLFDPFLASEIEAAKAIVLLKARKKLVVKVTPCAGMEKSMVRAGGHEGALVVRAPALVEIQLRRLEGARELKVERAAQIGRAAATVTANLSTPIPGEKVSSTETHFDSRREVDEILSADDDTLAKQSAIEAGAATGRVVRPLALRTIRERRGSFAISEKQEGPEQKASDEQKDPPNRGIGDYSLLTGETGAARRVGAALGARAAKTALAKSRGELSFAASGAASIEDSQVFTIPDVSPRAEYRLKIPAGTFTERSTVYTFEKGELTKVDYKKPSETLGAIAVPSNVVKKLVGGSSGSN